MMEWSEVARGERKWREFECGQEHTRGNRVDKTLGPQTPEGRRDVFLA